MKYKVILIILLLVFIGGCNSKECEHEFVEATCDMPKHCIKCNLEEGTSLDHSYIEATCEKAKTCSRCNKTFGDPLGHSYIEATCEKAKTCLRCNKTFGDPLGHIEKVIFPEGAECLIPEEVSIVCERCDKLLRTEEREMEHDLYEELVEATCTKNGMFIVKCHNCPYIERKIIFSEGHNYIYIVTKDVTEDEYGIKHKECLKCHDKQKDIAYVENGFSKHGKLSVKGADLVDKNNKKVQLVGLSTHGLQWFGDYVNYDTFESLKYGFGINIIRLSLYTSEDGYCVSDEYRKKQLFNIVCNGIDYCTDLDMYVMIDWHMLGAEDLNDRNPLYYKDEAVKFFKELTVKYKGYDNILFDIMNEPSGPVKWNDCKEYANLVIPTIRENSNGVIVVGNPRWSADLDSVMASPLEGFDNIMYSYHFYAGDKTNAQKIINAYNKGFPVFVSEHGGMENTGDGPIYYEYIKKWYEDLNMLNISYIAWNISNSKGSASIFVYNSSDMKSVDDKNLKEWGIYYRDYVRALFKLPKY